MNKPSGVGLFLLPSASPDSLGSVELPPFVRLMRPVVFGLWLVIFGVQAHQVITGAEEVNWVILVLATALFAGVHLQFWYEESEQGRRLHRALEQMRGHIYEDDNTGLPNSRHFVFQLRRQMMRSVRNGRGFSLMLVTLGSPGNSTAASDKLLMAAARSIRQSLGDCDFVARLQGPSFGAVVLDEVEATATEKAERVQEGLNANLPGDIPGDLLPVVSITSYEGELEVRDFLRRAQRDLHTTQERVRFTLGIPAD